MLCLKSQVLSKPLNIDIEEHDQILRLYTLFQNGHHFSILLFPCKLSLIGLLSNAKFKRIEMIAWISVPKALTLICFLILRIFLK